VGCLSVLACTLFLVVVVARGLHPLSQLARDVERRQANDLSAPIDGTNLPQELLPLVNELNQMFGRLGAAFDRERDFNSEVAHELRTPLAGLRSTIDVTLGRARQPVEYAEALADCRLIVVQLQSLVEQLLSLVRLESGIEPLRHSPVALRELIT